MSKFRRWLICLIVGKSPVMMNVDFNSPVTVFSEKGGVGFLCNCHFRGGLEWEDK